MRSHAAPLLTLALLLPACGDKETDDTAASSTEADADTDADSDSDADTDADTDTDATGDCAADPGADTACVDLLGSAVDIGGGTAWDGQGSLEGSLRMLWVEGTYGTDMPAMVIDVPNTITAGQAVDCSARPTYVLYQDASGATWNANVDYAYWGGACKVTMDAVSLTPGDEVSGHFEAEGVNADFTTDTMVGTFRATVIAP